MNVLRFLLKSIRIGVQSMPLYETYKEAIHLNIKHQSLKIRCLALESLGLLMIHDKSLFEEHLHVFMEAI
jgi:hypothetical protein